MIKFLRGFSEHLHVAVNSLKIYGFSMLGSVVGFAQSVLITRSLGAADYGTCAASAALVALISGFVGFRSAEALAYHIGRTMMVDRTGAATLIRFTILIDLLTSLLSAVAATVFAVVAKLMGGPEVLNPWVVMVYGFSGILACLANTATALAREDRRYWTLALAQAFGTIATFAAVAAIVDFDQVTVATVAGCSVAGSLIALLFFRRIINNFMQSHELRHDRRWNFREILNCRHQYKDFWYFMTCGFWASCLSTLVKKSDIVVLGYVASPATVGLYRVAQQGVSLVAKATGAVGMIVIKQFSEFGKNNKIKEGIHFGLRLSALFLPVAALAFAVIWLYADKVIHAVYGAEFANAAVVFQILSAGVLFAAAFVWLQPLLLAMNGARENLIVQVINAGVYFSAMALLAPAYGAVGAAIALSVAWITGNLAIAVAIKLIYQRKSQS